MTFYIILALLFIMITLFHAKKNMLALYLKKIILPLTCILFILSLILFSETALSAARSGIQLWLNIVFPSLFPFFVGSELLNKTGIIKTLGKFFEPIMRPLFNVPGCGSFTFAMGLTSGYPLGAKLTTSMRQERLLTKIESERLLAFSNNSGPLFIIGAVAVGMYQLPRLGIFLLSCHIAACISVGVLFRFYGVNRKKFKYSYPSSTTGKPKNEVPQSLNNPPFKLGLALGEAIKNSVGMMLAIGGFIIFFSVVIHLLLKVGVIDFLSIQFSTVTSLFGVQKPIVTAVLSGFFEITTGVNMTSKALNVPFIQQITAASVIIGWAGLSVHSQVLSIISDTDISIKPYLFGKALQGILAGCYTFLSIKIAGSAFLGDRPAFHSFNSPMQLHWQDYFLGSCKNLFLCIIFIIISAMLIRMTKLLFRMH